MTLLLLSGSLALASRPDTGGGLWTYEDSDVLEYVDGPGGLVRVTYSVDGPNQTILDDDDGSGAPDYAEEVAATAEDVLGFYESMGFRVPLSESDVGLGALGGSYAFDFYLIDFGGNADGMYEADRCTGDVCAGHMLMENDFAGYGYSSISTAIVVLTSHELFHAVQAAYFAEQEVWLSEGTAVWAELAFDPGNEDFFRFADYYLTDNERSLDEPPSGPVPSFAYSTALFWEFLDIRLGSDIVVDIQERVVDEDSLDAVLSAIEAKGSTIEEQWSTFARWNLATGSRAGSMESYEFAAELGGIRATEDGRGIEDDNRFYPLAASYYNLWHDGGPVYFVTPDDPTGLVMTLHHVDAEGRFDGPVEDALIEWAPTEPGRYELGDLDEGGYWLVGTVPQEADSSTKIWFCLGDEEDVAPCVAELDTGVEDTGGDDTGGDDTGDVPVVEDDRCGGCSSTRSSGAWLGLLGLLALVRRRED